VSEWRGKKGVGTNLSPGTHEDMLVERQSSED